MHRVSIQTYVFAPESEEESDNDEPGAHTVQLRLIWNVTKLLHHSQVLSFTCGPDQRLTDVDCVDCFGGIGLLIFHYILSIQIHLCSSCYIGIWYLYINDDVVMFLDPQYISLAGNKLSTKPRYKC